MGYTTQVSRQNPTFSASHKSQRRRPLSAWLRQKITKKPLSPVLGDRSLSPPQHRNLSRSVVPGGDTHPKVEAQFISGPQINKRYRNYKMQILDRHKRFAEHLRRTYPKRGEQYARNYLKVIAAYRTPRKIETLIAICQKFPNRYTGYSYAARRGGFTALLKFMESKGYKHEKN